MPQREPDPSASTAEFRAFVDQGRGDPTRASGVRSPAVVAAVVIVGVAVLAVVAYLIF